ncbi:putative peroxidase-related enzyme [Paraburkholderia atlantica]|uniref:Putative peroxidase-related enzyme n=1 Tax=Paraburkholderia atlantica TaxID=2654982 RepID=A0A7W8Q5W3_PARAM|nr:peroxidase-related enzyme [Paraburkholderia atlantica]MBB5423884.1 putative peroxidase-related enzyme [Paraburkholderia atlantica]
MAAYFLDDRTSPRSEAFESTTSIKLFRRRRSTLRRHRRGIRFTASKRIRAAMQMPNQYWRTQQAADDNQAHQSLFSRQPATPPRSIDMTAAVDSQAESALSRLRHANNDALPDDIQRLVQSHDGDNWIRALALNPDTTRRFVRYFEQLFGATAGKLPLAERELIAVVVSTTNRCGLCALHHTHALGAALDDPAKARRIATDLHFAGLSSREQALADLAIKVTQDPRSVNQEDFERLRGEGISEPAILEAVETASWFNHTNRIFISLGVVPDDKYFA